MKKTATKKKIELSDYMHLLLEEETGVSKEGRRLYQAVQLIDWDFVYKGAATWGLLNHEREEQHLSIHGRSECRLEMENFTRSRRVAATHDQTHISFYLAHCEIGTIDGSCITLTPKGATNVWMSFPNYDLDLERRKLVEVKLGLLKAEWEQARKKAREDGVIN